MEIAIYSSLKSSIVVSPLFTVRCLTAQIGIQPAFIFMSDTMNKASGKFASEVGVANRAEAREIMRLRASRDEEF